MAPRVIWVTSDSPAWVEAAKRLKKERGWESIYWVAPPKLDGAIEGIFPESVFHPNYDAYRGIPPEEIDLGGSHPPLDIGALRQYLPDALRMMDRMDMDGTFSHRQRVRLFDRLVWYWSEVVGQYEPDIVVFSTCPHIVADYLLYAVAQQKGIDTVIPTPTSIDSLVYFRERVETLPAWSLGSSSKYENTGENLPQYVEDHINSIRTSDRAMPGYMQEQRPLEGPVERAKEALVEEPMKIIRAITGTVHQIVGPAPENYMVKKGKPPESVDISGWQWKRWRVQAWIKKKQLRSLYTKLSEEELPKRPYIYVPLHYQPERTTAPEAGDFVEQRRIIRTLRAASPDGWVICVKEHPSQFSLDLKGELGRDPIFYTDLHEMEDVHLIDYGYDSIDLIDGAHAVGTATGTAGWESVLRGTPVLVFGSAWYSGSPGVIPVESPEDCQHALDRVRDGYEPGYEEVREFIRRVNAHGVRVGLDDAQNRDLGIGTAEAGRRLASGIMEFVDTLGFRESTSIGQGAA